MKSPLKLIEDLAREPSEEAMASVVASAVGEGWGVGEMSRLAEVLARSGTTLSFSEGVPVADVASTGAPASLSTLLCPLYLRDLGFMVPKLGVPGRPAGGIDVLAQVSGYKVALDAPAARVVLDRCGYAHFLAGPDFTPLDAALFQYRQREGAQNVPALAVASILSKKIACGLTLAGLDVRVAPHGNFGTDFDAARAAAKSFCLAAAAAGIAAVAGLSDARTPYQPYIGRGESLLALRELIEGHPEQWLAEHADRCRLLAAHVGALQPGVGEPAGEIAKPLFENIVAQGGTEEAFYKKTDAVARSARKELTADRNGFLSLDVPGLRSVFVAVNAPKTEGIQFPDDLGLILRRKPGSYVRRGDVLASVRADDAIWAGIAEPLTNCFQVVELMGYAAGMEEFVRA
jgi:pyrimidine-nucleoside phosphorylase